MEASVMSQENELQLSRRKYLHHAFLTIGGLAASQVASLSSFAQEPKKVERDPKLAERARAIMKDAFVIDAYNCGPYSKHRHEETGWFSRRGPTQVDFVKAIEGGLTAAGFDLGDGVRAPVA